MSVPTFVLNDGNSIPILGYGLGTANYGRESSAAVALAIQEGYFHLDGAEAYANDDSIGVGLAKVALSRDKLFYTAKCSSNDPKGYLGRALKTLGLDYVDMYLLHSPKDIEDLGIKRAWEVMESLQAAGLCKSIGVSNFRIQDIQELLKTAKVNPVVNQIELHPYLYAKTKPLIDLCHTNGIAVEVYGSLTPLTNSPGGPVDPIVERISREKGYTPGQILIKWSHQAGADIVLTTSNKASRLQEQRVPFMAMPDLTQAQVDELIQAGSSRHFRTFVSGLSLTPRTVI